MSLSRLIFLLDCLSTGDDVDLVEMVELQRGYMSLHVQFEELMDKLKLGSVDVLSCILKCRQSCVQLKYVEDHWD